MIRCAPKVWLSQEVRDDLERFSRSRTLSARLVERARIILRAAVGQENQQIADELGLCRQTVGRWRERFAAAQIDGLEDRPPCGRPARILTPTMDEVVRLTTQRKACGRDPLEHPHPGDRSRGERCHSGSDLAGTRMETPSGEEFQAE